MNAGRDTGSVMNHLNSRMRGGPEPEVGMGCTRLQWTDRTACTVKAIENGKDGKPKVILVQHDKAIRTDTNGMSESQIYIYEPDSQAPTYNYKRTKDGGWRRCYKSSANRWVHGEETEMLLVGLRDHYHDYSF